MGVNELSMADAFRYYRDELGLHVYPVDGPWSKREGAGKKPSIAAWWEYDPQDCNIEAMFNANGDGRCHNIGFAPRNAIVVVDLDSKKDQGKSVEALLAERPGLNGTPYHRTNGGAHLLYVCRDLPEWKHLNGRPFFGRLESKTTPQVDAELFYSDRTNVVLPPSRHVRGGVYRWEKGGEIAEGPWAWLQETFGFTGPAEAKTKAAKERQWHLRFSGDLHFFDLREMLEKLGHPPGRPMGPGKWAIFCPWRHEHTPDVDGVQEAVPSGSSVIWQHADGSALPGFKCLHAHCAGRGLKELLEWAEAKQRGVVDQCCKQERIWTPGQTDGKGRPRILHPYGRLDSEVHEEIAAVIAPKHVWFRRADMIVAIKKVPSGFVYSDAPENKFRVESYTVGLGELSPVQTRSAVEQHVCPGVSVKVKDEMGEDQLQFMSRSFSTDFCAGLVTNEAFKQMLPLARILTVPLPFRRGDTLDYPSKGYDSRFGTYLVEDAPAIDLKTPLKRAHEVLTEILHEFCFTNKQSRIHAIARLLTPFARGLIGWTTRTPFWFFFANRPRAGKDYLAGVALIVYEGHTFEDMPIGKDSEETSKRIVAAARSGRRFMHFSNCQLYLQDQYLAQALTNRMINARSLGSNDASSDLSLPNEIEYSASAQVGLTYREDFDPRIRQIELAFFEQDPNSRRFENTFLHRKITERRGEILSAMAALYQEWARKGFPKGSTPFTSYPEWAEVIGGVMLANGLGDPCLPFTSSYRVGGDRRTEAMTALFTECWHALGEDWVLKKELYECVDRAAEDEEALRYFGAFEGTPEARSNQTKLGVALHTFKRRILGDIRLEVDDSDTNSSRHKYQFVWVGTGRKPEHRGPREPSFKERARQFVAETKAKS